MDYLSQQAKENARNEAALDKMYTYDFVTTKKIAAAAPMILFFLTLYFLAFALWYWASKQPSAFSALKKFRRAVSVNAFIVAAAVEYFGSGAGAFFYVLKRPDTPLSMMITFTIALTTSALTAPSMLVYNELSAAVLCAMVNCFAVVQLLMVTAEVTALSFYCLLFAAIPSVWRVATLIRQWVAVDLHEAIEAGGFFGAETVKNLLAMYTAKAGARRPEAKKHVKKVAKKPPTTK
jgi:hypothetical protein